MYNPKKKNNKKKIVTLLFLCLTFSGTFQNIGTVFNQPNSASSTSDTSVNSFLWKYSNGMPGTCATMQPILANFSTNGISNLVVGTESGVAILNMDGSIRTTFATFGPVLDIELISDLNGDGQKDMIIVVYDKTHSNVYAVSSSNGTQLWAYNTYIIGFDSTNYINMNYTTRTWDSVVLNDINADGFQDVIISSWKYLYAVSGKDGTLLWNNLDACTDDIWKVKVIDDVNNDNNQEIIVGSENGEIVLINSKTGDSIWTKMLPTRTIWTNNGGSSLVEQITFRTSISDIFIIRDIDHDSANELLIAGDDGILRLYSGQTGTILDSIVFNSVLIPTTPQSIYVNYDEYELIEWVGRMFYKSGAKILETPDINNDGFSDFIVFSKNLEIASYSSVPNLCLITLNHTSSQLNTLKSFNLTSEIYTYPIIQSVNSQWRIYLQGRNIGLHYYIYDPLTKEISLEPTVVYEETKSSTHSIFYLSATSYTNCLPFLIEGNDQSGDGIRELFFFSAINQYALFNTVSESIYWMKYAKKGTASISIIQDLNGDHIQDYLYRNIRVFTPEWAVQSNGIQKPSYQIMSDITALNGIDGSILWMVTLPSYEYEGILNLTSIGDINNDGQADFAGWIIPSFIPQDILETLRTLYDLDSIPSSSSYDRSTIYRALMWNYTRLIVIDGSNGKIVQNKNLFETPYNFAREYASSHTTRGNYWNTINGRYDSSWIQTSSYPTYKWDEEWIPSSIIHPNNLTVQTGHQVSGNYFDLSGNQGNNFTQQNTNSLIEINQGKFNSTKLDCLFREDYRAWLINSTKAGGSDQIDFNCTFELNQSLPSEITALSLSYTGQLSKTVSLAQIMAWNYNTEVWTEIGSNMINSTSLVKYQFQIPSVEDYCDSDHNNQSKFRFYSNGLTLNHSIAIDQFAVFYNYQYKNLSIQSQSNSVGNSVVFNCSFALNFTDNLNLGIINYSLSQLDRISALKLQTQFKSNQSDSIFYNMTYQLWNFASQSWVECNWSKSDTYWNSGTNNYPELYGGWGSTYRSTYNHFEVDTSSYRTDRMYVLSRGTYDKDSSYAFDYQTRTSLSEFVDPISKNINVRFNISNSLSSFNLTMDTFGIQAFYWSTTPATYDSLGIWSYETNDFSSSNLLNLEVQDFVTINGTGDQYLDVLIILGMSSSESVQLRFFDAKNNQIYTKWETITQTLPTNNVKTIIYNISSSIGWFLIGEYQYLGTKLYSVKTVNNAYWTQIRSRFDPSPPNLQLDYGSSINLTRNSSNPVFFPILKQITKAGDLGLLMADIDYYVNYVGGVNIVNLGTFEILSKCPFTSTYRESTIKSLEDLLTKYQILIANEDFNGDGWLDHLGGCTYYNFYCIGIYSGNSGSISHQRLNIIQVCEQSSHGYTYCTESGCYYSVENNKIGFSALGDTDNDGKSELVYGLQSEDFGSSDNKGLEIITYNPESKVNSSWLLEDWKKSQWYSNFRKKVFDSFIPIEDLNQDGISEFYVKYHQTESLSENPPITEIVDIINSKILIRMAIPINSFAKTNDLNNDSQAEYLICSGNVVWCMNGEYKVKFTNIKSGDVKSGSFTLNWDSNSTDHPLYELCIDGTRYGYTTSKSVDVSLTSGSKHIEILMYDPSGVLISMDTITLIIETQPTMLIVTIVSIIGLVVAAIGLKIMKKRRDLSVLINEKPKSIIAPINQTEVAK